MVCGPKYVRSYNRQTVKEFKQELKRVFDLDPNVVQLYCRQIYDDKLLDDDFELRTQVIKPFLLISATTACDTDGTKNVTEAFMKMSEYLSDILTFYIEDINKGMIYRTHSR